MTVFERLARRVPGLATGQELSQAAERIELHIDKLEGALAAIVRRTDDEDDVYDYGRGAVEAVADVRRIAIEALAEVPR
jgi:hypothetical protein